MKTLSRPATRSKCAWIPAALLAGLAGMLDPAHAAIIRFDRDPFAGTPVLHAPGRQIVQEDLFLSFDPGRDTFVFSAAAFGWSGPMDFFNGRASSLSASGPNVIVLEDLDNDNNPLTPFGESDAANLIASHITTHGPGAFVYFDQALDLARIAFSTDLASTQSDIASLGRMLNEFGRFGQTDLARYTADNFVIQPDAAPVPEPGTVLLALSALGLGACFSWLGRARRPASPPLDAEPIAEVSWELHQQPVGQFEREVVLRG